LALFLFLCVLASPPLSPEQLETQIKAGLGTRDCGDGFWGIVIEAPARGRRLVAIHGERNFRPASNLKILTTLLALHHLGPEYRFDTAFYHSGSLVEGSLKGDLVVQGRGDPGFSNHYDPEGPSVEQYLLAIVDRLAAKGIERIEGDLVALEDFFDQDPIEPTWERGDIGAYYATPITALGINDAWLDLRYRLGAGGETELQIYPTWHPGFALDTSGVVLGMQRDLESDREWGSDRIRWVGEVRRCRWIETSISVWEPALQFAGLLRRALEQRGIAVTGELRVVDERPGLNPLFTLGSAPLAQLARVLMKESQNRYADSFLLTTARIVKGVGDFEQGEALAIEFLDQLETAEGFQLRDGSGMSTHNFIRPDQLVALLRFGLAQPYARQWIACFPSMGRDGTLEQRGAMQPYIHGRVWAKTGYIDRTRSLSGYLETRAAEPLLFSMIANNYGCETAQIEMIQDRICALMSRLEPPPDWDEHPMRGILRGLADATTR